MFKIKHIFNILFILFAVIGLTGYVWGTGTSSTVLPENMTPEQKNLFNYIMAKSGCDAGESTLVVQMLCDQLSTTDSTAFMLYMMNPNDPANLPGLNPQFTWNDYFTHDLQFINLKNRFDNDLRRFGGMTHEERLEYCKHNSNDFLALMNELIDCGDHNKINYVFENCDLKHGVFNEELGKINKDLQDDTEMDDSAGCKIHAERMKSFFINKAENISDAMITYDYLNANHQAPVIGNFTNRTKDLDEAISAVDSCAMDCFIPLTMLGVFILSCGGAIAVFVAITTLTLGAMAPILIALITLEAFLVTTFITLTTLTVQLHALGNELREIRDSLS